MVVSWWIAFFCAVYTIGVSSGFSSQSYIYSVNITCTTRVRCFLIGALRQVGSCLTKSFDQEGQWIEDAQVLGMRNVILF